MLELFNTEISFLLGRIFCFPSKAYISQKSWSKPFPWLQIYLLLELISVILTDFVATRTGFPNGEPSPIQLLFLSSLLQLFTASTRLRYSYICEPCRQRYHPDELQIADAVWWYYFSKLLEFCDTFFFILRKKESQLSFLHVYHHSTMFGLWWIGIKWVPSGSSK